MGRPVEFMALLLVLIPVAWLLQFAMHHGDVQPHVGAREGQHLGRPVKRVTTPASMRARPERHDNSQLYATELSALQGSQVFRSVFRASLKSRIVGGPVMPAEYSILGPFPFGVRELGGDPLSAFGGIFGVEIGGTQRYPSELVDGGYVRWSKTRPDAQGNVKYEFPGVRWEKLVEQMGQVIEFFQGWAVGTIDCVGECRFKLVCNMPLFFVDEVPCHGWCLVHLQDTKAILRLQLLAAEFQCVASSVPPPASSLVVHEDNILKPDIVDGQLPSPFFSPLVVNEGWQDARSGTAVVLEEGFGFRRRMPVAGSEGVFRMADGPTANFVPGQGVPLVLQLQQQRPVSSAECPVHLTIGLEYTLQQTGDLATSNFSLALDCKWFSAASTATSLSHSFSYTFLDFDNSVQYAVAIPPRQLGLESCPAIVSLHGAGVEANYQVWPDSYRRQAQAWILLPTGRGAYGYNWQGPGTSNVLHAISSFSNLTHRPPLSSLGRLDSSRILWAGHSMGGHGCYLLSSLFADYAVGAACASGWLRYEQYVPLYINQESTFADPNILSLARAAMAEQHTDTQAVHLVGLPVLVRTGGDDETVPAWNARRFVRVLQQQTSSILGTLEEDGLSSGIALDVNFTTASEKAEILLDEVPGQGHWWGGVVNDDFIQSFFDKHLYQAKPELPRRFRVISFSATRGSQRGGFRITRKDVTSRVANIDVDRTRNSTTWVLRTNNVLRFALLKVEGIRPVPEKLQIDVDTTIAAALGAEYCRIKNLWVQCSLKDSVRGTLPNMLAPRATGPAGRVFEGPVTIVVGTGEGSGQFQRTGKNKNGGGSGVLRQGLDESAIRTRWNMAKQLSNRLLSQGRYQVRVVDDTAERDDDIDATNWVLIGGPQENSWTSDLAAAGQTAGVQFHRTGDGFAIGGRGFLGEVGLLTLAARLTTNFGSRLALIIAGSDEGVENAFRLLPVMAPAPIPDWVIVDERQGFGWKGIGGWLAAGYWNYDEDWSFREESSYFASTYSF